MERKTKHFMVVDDNAFKLQDINDLILNTFDDVEVETFSCGADIIGAIVNDNHPCDMMILDMQMPMRPNGRLFNECGELVAMDIMDEGFGVPFCICSSDENNSISERLSLNSNSLYKGWIQYSSISSSWQTQLIDIIKQTTQCA